MKARACLLAVAALLSGCGSPVPSGSKQNQLPTVETPGLGKRDHPLSSLDTANLDINGQTVRVWIMNDPDKTREGMMFLTDKDVAADQGMLFVYPQAEKQSFWMRNTLIPLDIVFLDANGKLLNVVEGKPLDEKTHLNSKGPAQYVIELKAGTAKKLGAKPGLKIDIPPFARPQF